MYERKSATNGKAIEKTECVILRLFIQYRTLVHIETIFPLNFPSVPHISQRKQRKVL